MEYTKAELEAKLAELKDATDETGMLLRSLIERELARRKSPGRPKTSPLSRKEQVYNAVLRHRNKT